MHYLRLIALSLVVACSGAADRGAEDVVVTDSAGVAMVTNYRPVWGADSGWQIDSVPVTSIGGDERDRQQHFKYVIGALRLSDGRVVIANDMDVRWFSATGEYLRTTSRSGDGPGEFRYMRTLHRLDGDTIVVADGMGRRVATFGPDGSLARDERVDGQRIAALGRWEECDMALFPDGSRFACKSDPSIPATALNRPSRIVKKGWTSPGPGRLRQLKRTFVIPPALDTAYPLGTSAGIEQFGLDRGAGNIAFLQHPFYSRSIIVAGGHPMRIAMMLNPEYRIEIWTPTGTLERVIRRVNARRVPTAEERTAARDEMRRMEKRSLDPVSVERDLDAVPVPDTLAAAISMSVSTLGETVVQREGALPSQRASIFDVFNAEGRWLGEFRLARRTFIIEVERAFITSVRYDDDDVPHVEIHRLRR